MVRRHEIVPSIVPGTHGRMISKTQFEVKELVPHPKAPDMLTSGKTKFRGTKLQCENWVETQNA